MQSIILFLFVHHSLLKQLMKRYILFQSQLSCVDPESFVKGVQLRRFFWVFFVDEGRRDPNTAINGTSSARQQNAI